MNIWPFKKPAVPETPSQPVEPEGRLVINAITYDEADERIRVDIDWDDEFVNYLKRHGFTGTTDEAIVQKYVATLYRNTIDEMNKGGQAFE